MTHDDIAAIALSLPGVAESAHMGKRDFRAPKIFMSLPDDATQPRSAETSWLPA